MTLEQGMCNQIFRSADATEAFQAVKYDNDGEKPQEDTTELMYRAKKCQMMHYLSRQEAMQPKSCLCSGELGSGSHNSERRSLTPHWQFSEIISSTCTGG